LEKFEPIELRSNQFALVAAIAILAAWIPNLVSIPPILHIVQMDFGQRTPGFGDRTLVVDVLESSEIRANGSPVTLLQLKLLAHKMKAENDIVMLKPDPCAPYNTVIKAIVALKIAGPSNLRFADPDYSTGFEKALRPPDDRVWEGVLWSNATLNNEKTSFGSRMATTMLPLDECRTKAQRGRMPRSTS
jgi:hypothetical protein